MSDYQEMEMRSGRYCAGQYLVRADSARAELLESYILEARFLDVSEDNRLYSHNKRYRVYCLKPRWLDSEVILKISWASPDYKFWRRANIIVSQLFKNYSRSAFEGALMLARAGINTINPLACWTYNRSVLRRESYFMYEKLPAEYSIRDVRLKAEGGNTSYGLLFDEFVEKMARLVAGMHERGLRHDDMASGNILVQKEGDSYRLAVIDTDHISVNHVPFSVLKLFFDLKCMRRLDFDEETRRRFLRLYLGADYSERWWPVMEFWRKGGNRPLHALYRMIVPREERAKFKT